MAGRKRRATLWCKRALMQVLPDSPRWRYLAHLPRLERWRREHVPGAAVFRDRFALYDHLNETVLERSAVEFLEFGVYRGASIRRWAEINAHPDSRFVGFDTFEGLPEPWAHFTETSAAALYDTGGCAPDIDDARVRFVKGMFQGTLPHYLRSRSAGPARLVLHLDADLYASTLYVLTRCDPILGPGTILVFDELSAVLHEFRALEDYCAAYRRTYELLATTRSPTSLYDQSAIRML